MRVKINRVVDVAVNGKLKRFSPGIEDLPADAAQRVVRMMAGSIVYDAASAPAAVEPAVTSGTGDAGPVEPDAGQEGPEADPSAPKAPLPGDSEAPKPKRKARRKKDS